ncbi:hypothetical protein Tco_0937857 [Tanacetum coccineum]|uniref:Uncharacterized protein n=1 Tax=Tanacetum coccineum TaxID=301880 RepID=A0ABQ5DG63_9ASTR
MVGTPPPPFEWAIPDSMVWRHPSAAIDDPWPATSSFSIADVRHLTVHVIKLRDMPRGRLPFYCTPPAAFDVVIPDPTPKDLAVGTPSAKILAKTEASQKRKASTSGVTSSHVSKRTRSALAQSSGSTTHPSLFVDNSDDESDDDGDACDGTSAAPVAEGPSTRDSRGKGIMVDDVVAPFASASRPRPSFGFVPLFRDVSGDAIHADFFSFSVGPYYAAYPEGGVTGNYEYTREE